MLLNEDIILKYFDNPTEENKVLNLLNSKECTNINEDKEHGNSVLNNALYYSIVKYPGIKNIKTSSFAGLVAYLTSGWYGGFGTENYQPERTVEVIIRNWKNVSKLNEEEFTKKAIKFLEYFYFKNYMETIELITGFNIEDPEITANVIMYLLAANNKIT